VILEARSLSAPLSAVFLGFRFGFSINTELGQKSTKMTLRATVADLR
jgi:hypothetical protein